MRLIELHILQSFPVSCLNRDEVGQPKSAVFGGVKRARLSSQTLKRATRLDSGKQLPEFYTGKRTRYLPHLLAENVPALRDDPGLLTVVVARLAEFLRNKVDTNPNRFTTLVFSSSTEKARLWERVSRVISELSEQERAALKGETSAPPANQTEPSSPTPEGEQSTAPKQAEAPASPRKRKRGAGGTDTAEAVANRLKAAFQESFGQHDAADIAIFGRMVADFPNLTVESAAMFSHALSTHETAADYDFFAAVDEQKPSTESIGAAITDTLQYTSAVYYRYVALNLDLLADSKHLGGKSPEQRQKIVNEFIRSTLVAVPGTHEDAGRKNSMNAHTLPHFVLGLFKESGQPVQLVNAFETPIPKAREGYLGRSVDALKTHYEDLKVAWNLNKQIKEELEFPKKDKNGKHTIDLDKFCETLSSHAL